MSVRPPESRPVCVIGDLSMVRCLGIAGYPAVVATTNPHDPCLRSRHCQGSVSVRSFVDEPDGAVQDLLAYGAASSSRPILFYQGDHDLLAVSRHRSALRSYFDFVIGEATLVEQLVDKLRFASLADRLGLPVPRTMEVPEGDVGPGLVGRWRTYPCVVKPNFRGHWFESELVRHQANGPAKVVCARNARELQSLWPLMQRHGGDFVVQELVDGPERNVLSYHCYVRPSGELASEFTGRKIRTFPASGGMSTFLELTDDRELRRVGRDVVNRLGLTGVAKLDFKADPRRQKMQLLEVNPRFNLWHHMGAHAGINIPAQVCRDITGRDGQSPQAPAPASRPVRWMAMFQDLRAARALRSAGLMRVDQWLWQLATCTINEDFCLSDPAPAIARLTGTLGRRSRALLHGEAR